MAPFASHQYRFECQPELEIIDDGTRSGKSQKKNLFMIIDSNLLFFGWFV